MAIVSLRLTGRPNPAPKNSWNETMAQSAVPDTDGSPLEDASALFLRSQPENVNALGDWSKTYAHYHEVEASGLGEVLGDLIHAILTSMPANPRDFMLRRLRGEADITVIERSRAYEATHAVYNGDTSLAREAYMADHGVLDLLRALLEEGMTELRGR